MTPFYAQRRALLVRGAAEHDYTELDAAFTALAGEKIGAMVVTGPLKDSEWLIKRGASFGLEPAPFYLWRNTSVFLRPERRAENARKLEQVGFLGVSFAPGAEPQYQQPANAWFDVASLPLHQRLKFSGMQPTPVRFFCRFGLALELKEGRMDFGAHPVTRLVFALPAGRHVLRSSVMFSPDAYRHDLPEDSKTDGVEITLFALGPGGERRVLNTRLMDPSSRVEDRGRRPLRIEFALPQAGEVELFIGPGSNGRDTRDWVVLGPLGVD